MAPILDFPGDSRRLLRIELSDELIDQITERAAELVQERPCEPDGFLNVPGAAEFLACSKSRIYALVSAGRIPHHRDGSRLLFDRGELRDFVRNGGARRP